MLDTILRVILYIMMFCLCSMMIQVSEAIKKYFDSRTIINDMNNWLQLQNLLAEACKLEVDKSLAKYRLSLEEYKTPRAYAEAKSIADSVYRGFTDEFKLRLYKIYPHEELMSRIVDLCAIYLTDKIKEHNAEVIDNVQLS